LPGIGISPILRIGGTARSGMKAKLCLHGEMKTVVNEFHKVNLVILNLGPNAVTGLSAAYAINELVRPAAVIATHVNEGATAGGKVKPTTRTAAFINLVKGRPVYPALSGRTMEFDGTAKCVAGC
jgi:hypothetical protein